MTAVATEAGPLTTDADLPESLLFGTDRQAAEWLAYVGLRGRFVPIQRSSSWMRWDGRTWQTCPGEHLQSAIRQALSGVYDRHMEQRPDTATVMQLLRLKDVNWQLGRLTRELRKVLTLAVDSS